MHDVTGDTVHGMTTGQWSVNRRATPSWQGSLFFIFLFNFILPFLFQPKRNA